MSMPSIALDAVSCETVANGLIASAALIQAALAHILNAEGEYIQKLLTKDGLSPEALTDINRSLETLLCCSVRLETELRGKVALAVGLLKTQCPPPCPGVSFLCPRYRRLDPCG